MRADAAISTAVIPKLDLVSTYVQVKVGFQHVGF